MTQELEQIDEKRHLETKRDEKDKPRPQTGGLLGKYTGVELFAYILAGSSAIAATWSSIGKMHAEKMRNNRWVKDLKEIRQEGRNDLENLLEAGLITQDVFKTRINTVNETYTSEYTKRMKLRGTETTYSKWMELPSHQRIGTALTIFGILSIAGVAIYTIARERSAHKKFQDERDERIKAQAEVDQHKKTAAQTAAQESSFAEKYIKTEPVAIGAKTQALLSSREAAATAAVETPASYQAM